MAHVGTDGNHADIRVCKHLAAVPHHGFFLSCKDQGIHPFVLADERVACNLVVPDVCTQLHEALILCCESGEMLFSFSLHLELLACVHGEPVHHNLPEETVVDVGLPSGLQPAVPHALSEEAVGNASAGVENQADRDNKDGHKEVEHPCVNEA